LAEFDELLQRFEDLLQAGGGNVSPMVWSATEDCQSDDFKIVY